MACAGRAIRKATENPTKGDQVKSDFDVARE
jgi:hypothetical protein